MKINCKYSPVIITVLLTVVAIAVNLQDFVFGTTKGNRILELVFSIGTLIAWIAMSFIFGKSHSKKYLTFLTAYCGISILLTGLTVLIQTDWNLFTVIIPGLTVFLPMYGIIRDISGCDFQSWIVILVPVTFAVFCFLSVIMGRIIKIKKEG